MLLVSRMDTKQNHQIKIENELRLEHLIQCKMEEMVMNLLHIEKEMFNLFELDSLNKTQSFMMCKHLTLIKQIGTQYQEIILKILSDVIKEEKAEEEPMEVDQHLQNDSEGIPPPIVVITNVHEDASFVSMKAENTEDQPPINQHEQRVKENTNRTAHHHEEETESDNDMEHQNTNTSVQNNNTAQNPQQQKLQMARTLVEVSKGSVSLERVMAMSFDEVQNLHNKIVYRLNKSGQQQQAQCDQFNSNNISNQTTAPSQQNRAQDDDPSSINTGAPTQPNNVNIAQNNVIKAQQTT
eukprot:652328_1